MAKKVEVQGLLPKKNKDIRRDIIKPEQQVYRIQTNMLVYKDAVISAESIVFPYRYPLYQVYKQCELDAHLTAAVQQRKNLILGSKFNICGPDGKVNEEKTKLIQTKWFRDHLDYSLDSMYWGHSLEQFGSIVNNGTFDEFTDVELVPRIYVKPEVHIVANNIAAMTGQDYLESPWNNWTIGVGRPRDLGLYLKAAPLVIWKKNAMGAWSEFIERFGVPPIIGKTNVRDDTTRNNMNTMLKNMRVGLYAVLDKDDEVLPVQATTQDAYKVFDQLIARCNSELSKLILGQTMTLDDGSSKSQAEVHEAVVEGYEDSDKQFIYVVNNYQLIPMMNRLGFGLEGMNICCESEDEWSLNEKSVFDVALIKSGKFTMTPEYIKEKYGTEVIPVAEPTEPAGSKTKDIQNALDELYR